MANNTAEQQPQEILLDPTSDAVVVPATNTDPRVGDKQADGTVFAGISPNTGKAMYARPSDEPYTMKWQRAMDYAARYEGHGHPAGTFRVPTQVELKVLFKNRAAIGGFNPSCSRGPGLFNLFLSALGNTSPEWYWSATEIRDYAAVAWGQSFIDGGLDRDVKVAESRIRLVRS